MPKQTFFNLPQAKQDTILNAAMQEFATAGYDLSSIQKIIKASDVSRGSFYQYFEDKADLFAEVMFIISTRKMKYIRPVMERSGDMGLFELLKDLVIAGVEFGINDPIAFQIGKSITASKTLDLMRFIQQYKQSIYERNHITEEAIYAKAIQLSLERGEIDSRFTMESVLNYANKTMEAMAEIYWHFMANQGDPHAGDKILDDWIHVLRYGLSSTNKPG